MTNANQDLDKNIAPLNTSQRGDEINLLDLLSVIVQNARLLILGPLLVGFIALGTTTFLITPTYTAKTSFLPPNEGNSTSSILGSLSGAAALLGSGGAAIGGAEQRYIAYLKSNQILDQLITKYQLQERYGIRQIDKVRRHLINLTRIQIADLGGLILIEFDDADPNFAANMANEYVTLLSKMLTNNFILETQAKQSLLERQIIAINSKTFPAPLVRETIKLALFKEYETSILDLQKTDSFILQIDVATAPEHKSKPKRAIITIVAIFITFISLLCLVFIQAALKDILRDPEVNIKKLQLKKTLIKQFFL